MALKTQYQAAVINNSTPVTSGSSQTAVTFGSAVTTSSVLDCSNVAPTGIIFPSGWAAGNLSFNVTKVIGGDLVPLVYFDGTSYSIPLGNGPLWLPLQPALFNSITALQLVSSVNQTNITVDFALAPIYSGIHN